MINTKLRARVHAFSDCLLIDNLNIFPINYRMIFTKLHIVGYELKISIFLTYFIKIKKETLVSF